MIRFLAKLTLLIAAISSTEPDRTVYWDSAGMVFIPPGCYNYATNVGDKGCKIDADSLSVYESFDQFIEEPVDEVGTIDGRCDFIETGTATYCILEVTITSGSEQYKFYGNLKIGDSQPDTMTIGDSISQSNLGDAILTALPYQFKRYGSIDFYLD